ncbi:rhomboid family intramembrane serine protease [Roseimicrobium sp. ORNL1]|uniref:rhomboid family intramembrane serine protease n=1 Tax=Roseimicrobium sp. ORNL1 TaxID=2711231 RepID=UPI0013E18199|nr:rhomboid family intramembrane serine protease [Roseimicrobium sp. ORNL1]QIF00448.1 hypothetical protein G5S37_02545 [Roseimicrobium sp. ORNL1]
MNSFLNSLENRFGRFAIPGLVAILAIIQAAVWVMVLFFPGFVDILVLHRALVDQGEVWRLITWIFIPNSFSVLWLLFGVMLMLTFSSVLDHAWGAFKVNLYVFSGILFIILGHWFFGSVPTGLFLYGSIFLAFCVIVPDYEISLYLIMPIKVKYLGLITGGISLLTFIGQPDSRSSIFFAHLNFLLAFTPGFIRMLKQRGTVVQRRARFDSAKAPQGTFFHKCANCGKTDLDDPKLEFRVTSDGEEYCTICRPRKSLVETTSSK